MGAATSWQVIPNRIQRTDAQGNVWGAFVQADGSIDITARRIPGVGVVPATVSPIRIGSPGGTTFLAGTTQLDGGLVVGTGTVSTFQIGPTGSVANMSSTVYLIAGSNGGADDTRAAVVVGRSDDPLAISWEVGLLAAAPGWAADAHDWTWWNQTVGNAMALSQTGVLTVAGGISSAGPLTVLPAAAGPSLIVESNIATSPRGIASYQNRNGTDGAMVGCFKSRGTYAVPTVVSTGDTLGQLLFWGYDGAAYQAMGAIEVVSTGVVGANRVPTYMTLSTATNAAPSVLTERMRLTETGLFGLNTTTPGFTVHVLANTSATACSMALESYGVDPSYPVYFGRRARGVIGAPTAVQTGDHLLVLAGRGYMTDAWPAGSQAAMFYVAIENFTNIATGTAIYYETCPVGSTVRAEVIRFHGSGGVSVGDTTDPGDNNLRVAGGLTVVASGITVTAGGIGVTAGGLTITAGGLGVTEGGATIVDTGGQAVVAKTTVAALPAYASSASVIGYFTGESNPAIHGIADSGAYTGTLFLGHVGRAANSAYNLVDLRVNATVAATSLFTIRGDGLTTIAAGGLTITAGGLIVDAGLARFDGNGTRVFELPADATGNLTGATGRIPILIGAGTKYLRYYDD